MHFFVPLPQRRFPFPPLAPSICSKIILHLLHVIVIIAHRVLQLEVSLEKIVVIIPRIQCLLKLTNLRLPPSPAYGCVLVDCSGESEPIISPTESSRIGGMPKHGPPPPVRRVGCTAPERSGSEPAAVSGDLMTSLRAKQPRRSGSQLWYLTGARAESRGLSNSR